VNTNLQNFEYQSAADKLGKLLRGQKKANYCGGEKIVRPRSFSNPVPKPMITRLIFTDVMSSRPGGGLRRFDFSGCFLVKFLLLVISGRYG